MSYNTQNKVENGDELSTEECDLLSPWFVSGFVDAEGSFIVIVRKNANYRMGWHPIFPDQYIDKQEFTYSRLFYSTFTKGKTNI